MSKTNKLHELGRRLEATISVFLSMEAHQPAHALREFCSFLKEFPNIDLKTLSKVIGDAVRREKRSDAGEGSSAANTFSIILSLAKSLDAKKAIIDTLGELSALFVMAGSANVSFDDLRLMIQNREAGKPVRQRTTNSSSSVDVSHEVVAGYLVRLESALGKSSFEAVYQALTKDKRVRKAEAAAIASGFVTPTAKSTSKDVSFRRIKERHDNWIDSVQKEATLAGKSAA